MEKATLESLLHYQTLQGDVIPPQNTLHHASLTLSSSEILKITSLIPYLSSDDHNLDLACQQLTTLTKNNNELSLLCITLNITPLLLDVILHRKAQSRRLALKLIAQLAIVEEFKDEMRVHGGIRILLNCIDNEMDIDVKSMYIEVLNHLVIGCKKNKVQLYEDEGIEQLVGIVEDGQEEIQVRLMGLSVLGNAIVGIEENKSRLVNTGGVGVVLGCLEKENENYSSALVGKSCLLLRNLCANHNENLRRVMEMGGERTILQTLEDWINFDEETLIPIIHLSTSLTPASLSINEKLITTLQDINQSHPHSSELSQTVSHILKSTLQ